MRLWSLHPRYLDPQGLVALARGYSFDATKVGRGSTEILIPVSAGQIEYEWDHLLRKLSNRSPARYREVLAVRRPQVHPLMRRRGGGIESWERDS